MYFSRQKVEQECLSIIFQNLFSLLVIFDSNILILLLLLRTFEDEKMFDISVTLKRTERNSSQIQEWWIVNQTEPGLIQKTSQIPKFDTGLEFYVFSDQVSPPSLGFLAGYGYVMTSVTFGNT